MSTMDSILHHHNAQLHVSAASDITLQSAFFSIVNAEVLLIIEVTNCTRRCMAPYPVEECDCGTAVAHLTPIPICKVQVQLPGVLK